MYLLLLKQPGIHSFPRPIKSSPIQPVIILLPRLVRLLRLLHYRHNFTVLFQTQVNILVFLDLVCRCFFYHLVHDIESLSFQTFTIELVYFVDAPYSQKVNDQDSVAKNHSGEYRGAALKLPRIESPISRVGDGLEQGV